MVFSLILSGRYKNSGKGDGGLDAIYVIDLKIVELELVGSWQGEPNSQLTTMWLHSQNKPLNHPWFVCFY